MTDLPRLLEQLHAGCGGSLGCQLLHQQAAEALEKAMQKLIAIERIARHTGQHFIADEIQATCQDLQDTPTLTGPNDGALIYATARAMAHADWVDGLVRDIWADQEPSDQEYYLKHARIARGMPVRGEG